MPAYKPRGVKYPSAGDALEAIGQPTLHWTYTVPYSKESTWVLRYDRPDGSKKYRVITFYKGGWYVDQMPPVPYPIFRKNQLREAETVYVFGTEGKACEGLGLGLVTTTSMAGPFQAAMSDWSPLEEKHVVIVRDFDDMGQKYADDVAQLVLAAGAHSAKIVTLPGLSEGEGIRQWIGDRDEKEGTDVLRAEIEALALAAAPVERQIVPTQATCTSSESQIEVKRLSEVTPETLEWVWASVIPLGALTLITGEPGVGKSLFTLEVAAAVTRGDRGPHDRTQGIPAAVILFSGQDDLAKTIRPRLEAAGANVSLIYAFSSAVQLEASDPAETTVQSNVVNDHLSALEAEIRRLKEQGTNVGLVVIDTLSSFAGWGNQHSEARMFISRLAELATRLRVAIMLTSDAGSTAATGQVIPEASIGRAVRKAARSVWSIFKDLDNPKRRILLPVKTNLCEEGRSLAYSVQDGAIQWESEPIDVTNDDFIAEVTERSRKPINRRELDRVTEWLRERLSTGPVLSNTLKEEAEANDMADITLRRAFDRLKGIAAFDKAAGRYAWELAVPELR